MGVQLFFATELAAFCGFETCRLLRTLLAAASRLLPGISPAGFGEVLKTPRKGRGHREIADLDFLFLSAASSAR